MAYTLVDVVNKVLLRARVLDSAEDTLTSLSKGSIQIDIDTAVDSINDVIREVVSLADLMPYKTNEGSITLATGTREYALPAGALEIISKNLVERGEGHWAAPYPGGYEAMFSTQVDPDSYTGQPSYWVINPVTDYFRLDNTPTAAENGDIYYFLYTSGITVSLFNDTFPFRDGVMDALLKSVVQNFMKTTSMGETFDAADYMRGLGQAVQAIVHTPKQRKYA